MFKTGNLSGRTLLLWCSTLFACALIATPLVLCLWFVAAFAVDLPIGDQWHCVSLLHGLYGGKISWLDLFLTLHGKHITGVPFVIMGLLAPYTGYDTRVEMFAGVAILFSACVALSLMAWQRTSKGWAALLALVPIAWLVMSLRQHEAILGGVMGGFEHIAVSSFFVITVYLLDQVVSLGWPLVLAMLTATCCVFSLGNGILVLPFGALQLALSGFAFRRIPRRTAFVAGGFWGIFSLGVGTAYLAVYERSIDTEIWDFFRSNLYADAQFFLAFLGSPLNVTGDTGAAIATAVVLAAILAVVVVAVAGRSARMEANTVAPVMLLAYALVSDFLITMGRVHFGVDQATTSRYVCIGYVGIASLYLILLSARTLPSRARVYLMSAFLVFVFTGSVAAIEDGLLWGRVRHYYRLGMANLLRNYKLHPTSDFGALAKKPEKVRRYAPFLEDNHLSVFRDPSPEKIWSPLVAPTVALETIISPARESAGQLPVFAVDSRAEEELSFSGWVVDRVSRGPAGGVLICVDDKLEIPAAYGLDRPDIAAAWRRSNCHRSGFSTSCLTSIVGGGRHAISLKVLSPDRTGYYRTPTIALLLIEDANLTGERADRNGKAVVATRTRSGAR